MANEFDLSSLVDWTRRTGGDVVSTSSQSITADGTSRRYTLSADGSTIVTLVEEDLEAVDSADYTAAGGQITFPAAPAEGTLIDVTYTNSRYSDDDVLNCVIDAARIVKADVKQSWRVDVDNQVIVDPTTAAPTDPPTTFFDKDGNPDDTLQKLIVYRAAVSIYMLKAASAADDAIMIKDGDTTINTSLTAKSTDVVVKRLIDTYTADLRRYRSERFVGAAQSDGYCPFNILVRHREDGTVFLYNY